MNTQKKEAALVKAANRPHSDRKDLFSRPAKKTVAWVSFLVFFACAVALIPLYNNRAGFSYQDRYVDFREVWGTGRNIVDAVGAISLFIFIKQFFRNYAVAVILFFGALVVLAVVGFFISFSLYWQF